MKQKLVVYWVRRDLRMRDNPALGAALARSSSTGAPFAALFFIEPYMTSGDPTSQFGYPSRYFLMKALPEFARNFTDFGIFHERPARFFAHLGSSRDVEIFVNEDVHPDFYAQVEKIRARGIAIDVFRDQLTIPRDTVSGAGERYSVFTPFKKAVWKSFVNAAEEGPCSCEGVSFEDVSSLGGHRLDHADAPALLKLFSHDESIEVGGRRIDLASLGLPRRDLSGWYMSEREALERFDSYLKKGMSRYKDSRDSLGEEGTSRMSLALTWGLVSARTLVAKMRVHFKDGFESPLSLVSNQGAMTFISELIWREFYKYLWFHRPELFSEPFQEKRRSVAWVPDEEARIRFDAWMKGKTGYPLVDAAMMQLARTGWMHNRARMVVSSVLTKNLGVDWRWGQEYFRAMLIDLDEASNNGGWQWGASVGADPKPIRIFNPYLQAENYDPDQTYRNAWLDEAYQKNPPEPIVPHEQARAEALARYGAKEEAA